MKFFKAGLQKIKNFDYGKFFGSKAFLISGCVLIIVAAVIVNAVIPRGTKHVQEPSPTEGGAQILGNSVLASAGESNKETGTGYFSQAVVNRENTRNEAMEVLKAIADSPDALADAKEKAMLDIAAIAEEMSAEATIEQLVKAKGFKQCVCVVSDGKASVVVNAEEALKPAQVAQILEIVYLETGILPASTKVMASQEA